MHFIFIIFYLSLAEDKSQMFLVQLSALYTKNR